MKKELFFKGIKDGIPICIGYFAVAFAFGIFCVSSGLTTIQTVLISATNVTSAGQLAAVPIIVTNGSYIEMSSTQFIINLRYSLMSIILSQKLDKKVTWLDKMLIAFVNTDEVFAVSSSQNGDVKKEYMFGLITTPWIGWVSGTLAGCLAGDILPELVINGLAVAIYGMFIAIVVPQVKAEKNMLACCIIAMILSICFKFLPVLNRVSGGFVIIICSIVASVIMAILKPIEEDL